MTKDINKQKDETLEILLDLFDKFHLCYKSKKIGNSRALDDISFKGEGFYVDPLEKCAELENARSLLEELRKNSFILKTEYGFPKKEEQQEELTELDKVWLKENLSAHYFPMSLKSMEESKNRYEQAFYACNTLYANLHMDNSMVDILHKIKPYLSTIESYALKEWQSYLDDIIERKKELRAMREEEDDD